MNNNTVVSVFGISPYRIGAFEIFARELSLQLGKLGWHSVLCYLTPPPEPVRQFLTLPNVTIEVIEDAWQLSRKATGQLYHVLKKHRPRILHLYFTGFLSAYPWLAKWLQVEKVYFTDQSSQPEGFVPSRAPLWKRAAMRVINGPMDGVISVSGYGYRNFTARDLLPKSRFHTIYNSVDIARAKQGSAEGVQFRMRFQIPADCPVVTQVSSMIPEKGVQDLLTAAAAVLAAEPDTRFVLAGEGSHRDKLEKMAMDSGIDSHVIFTGVVQDPLADGLYGASDVVCQMSRWEEVFGYVIAEAMATGKPVVGTRVGGIPELISDGETGFLVNRGDTAAMSAKILELLRNPEQRRRMGEAGLRAATARFNHTINVAQAIALYQIAT
ncbi:MAG: glycosyltransferase family 4 protein [Bryobacteraceae bacterium]